MIEFDPIDPSRRAFCRSAIHLGKLALVATPAILLSSCFPGGGEEELPLVGSRKWQEYELRKEQVEIYLYDLLGFMVQGSGSREVARVAASYNRAVSSSLPDEDRLNVYFSNTKPNPAGLKVFQFDYKAVERFYFPRLSIFINTWLSEFPVRSFLALNLYQNFSVYEQSLSYIKEQGILGFGREAVIEQWGEKERILQGSDGWRRAMEIYDKLRENSLWRHEELERRYLVYRGRQNISGLTDTPCWLKATLRW